MQRGRYPLYVYVVDVFKRQEQDIKIERRKPVFPKLRIWRYFEDKDKDIQQKGLF